MRRTLQPFISRLKLPYAAHVDSVVMSGSFMTTLAMRLISTIVLSRLLAPEAFGAVGIMMSLAYVVQMVSDVGFADFVIRHKDGNERRFLDVIWTIRLIRGFILTALLYLLAGPVSLLLGKPELKTLCEVFSLYFVLESSASLALVTALRNKRVARYNLVEIISNAIQVVASISLALMFKSYWAIVASIGVGQVVRAVLSYVMFPGSVRRVRFNRTYAAEQFHFARYITGSSIITLLLSQSDKLILSRLFPLDTLGLYVMAANLAQIPTMFALNYCSQLLYPRYARLWREEPEALPDAYYAAQRPLGFLYMLAVGGMIASAPLIVEVLYDHRYKGASLFLSMLGFVPLLALNNGAATNVGKAMGRFGVQLKANFARLGWIGTVGPLAWWLWGPIGLIGAFASAEVPALVYQWGVLRSLRILSIRKELQMMGVATLGMGLGYGATIAVFAILTV